MHEGERFNSITHIVGAAAALVGVITLIVLASQQGDVWKIVSFSIYGASLFLLYTFSSIYHSSRGALKPIFRKLEYSAIYCLIAGTYTPFALVTLRDGVGWPVLCVIWALAIIGVIMEALPKKSRAVPIAVYLAMGWLIMAVSGSLLNALPSGGFLWLLAGGLFYTVGVFFYVFDKRVVHFHGIWHLFVMAGSLTHYITIYRFIL